MLFDHDDSRRGANSSSLSIDAHTIDCKPFVRVTFPDGNEETIYGFNTRADAIKWIRCEAVVWLYERREKQKRVAS
jgi:hypothetical protein